MFKRSIFWDKNKDLARDTWPRLEDFFTTLEGSANERILSLASTEDELYLVEIHLADLANPVAAGLVVNLDESRFF